MRPFTLIRGAGFLLVSLSKSKTLAPAATARLDPSGEKVSAVTGSAAADLSVTTGKPFNGSTSEAIAVSVSEPPSNFAPCLTHASSVPNLLIAYRRPLGTAFEARHQGR